MKIENFLRTMLLAMMLLTAICTNAVTISGGTITLKYGESYHVDANIGGSYNYQQGTWSRSGSVFTITSRSDKSCTITGTDLGTGTLYYKGVAGYYDLDFYWTVNVVPSGSDENIAINATNFPDANFRNFLLEKSYGQDGVLTPSEIKGITYIWVNGRNISSLKGIEYFTALTELDCHDNQLTTLDVSKNTALITLQCHTNQITTLDISNNSKLRSLECYRNQLTSLNVSNTAIEYISCFENKIMGAQMDAFINSLPRNTTNEEHPISIYRDTDGNEDNVCTKSQAAAIKAKGWTPKYYNGREWTEYEGNDGPTKIVIDEINFPDENFRNYLLEQSYGKDGVLVDTEIKGITRISVSNKNISSLKGIEYFTALKTLYCYSNQLTTLDVSKNTALKTLYCYSNQLTDLDVSKNTALTDLFCGNNQLATLDVSKNTALTDLSCYSNQLTALDVSKNIALTSLNCGWNPLTSLDLSRNTILTELECYSCQLTTLDVSKHTALMKLSCGANHQLTTLDVSKNTALIELECKYNRMTSLDVSKNPALTNLSCSNNQLTSLDVSKNKALTILRCNNNQIRGEFMDALINNLPQNTTNEKYELHVCGKYDEGNVCTTTHVAVAKAKGWTVYDDSWTEYEGIDPNSFITIDESNFPDDNFRNYLLGLSYGKDAILTEEEIKGITSISVNDKNISSLKGIEHLTALASLSCSNNQLTTLDVSKNTALTSLSCYSNQLTALDISKNTVLTSLLCENNQLTALDVSKSTALTTLNCGNNQLTVLDVSKNIALTTLYCYGNQLTTLDVSKNAALSSLYCYGNQLTILEVSKNTELTSLNCGNNQLKVLDASKNTALTSLSCYSNQLTILDVSKNAALTNLLCYNNQIKGASMDAVISSLPQNNTNEKFLLKIYRDTEGAEGNVCTKSQVVVIRAKGWTPQYYNGTEWVEYEGSDEPMSKGLVDNPFTPAEANAYGSALAANEQSQENYYIRGMVVSIKEQFGMQYGNATFYISADGTEKDQFYIYRALYLENTKYAGQDLQLRVGDDVVVCGKITNYLGTLPETVQNQAYVVSINENTSGIEDVEDVKAGGTADAPVYTLSGQKVTNPANAKKGVYIVNGKKVVVK